MLAPFCTAVITGAVGTVALRTRVTATVTGESLGEIGVIVSVPLYVPAERADGLLLTFTPIEKGVAAVSLPPASHGPPAVVVAAVVKLIGAPALEIVRVCQDLVSVYDALKQPGKARQYQAELAATRLSHRSPIHSQRSKHIVR